MAVIANPQNTSFPCRYNDFFLYSKINISNDSFTNGYSFATL